VSFISEGCAAKMKQVTFVLKIVCLYFQLKHVLGRVREFTKATSFHNNVQIRDESMDINVGIQQRTHDTVGRKIAIDDGEITNNSEDTRKILYIQPFVLTLRPTPSALTPTQISKTIVTMENLLMEKLGNESQELSLVSAVDLSDIAEVAYFPAQAMLRNGKSLSDNGTTAAYSTFKVDGGTANTTFSIYYDSPTNRQLNVAVIKILNENLVDILRVEDGFLLLEQAAAETYVPTPSTQNELPQTPIVSRKSSSSPIAVSLGSIAVILAVLGLAFYAWKNGSMKKLSGKYSHVRSNLRLKSLKRSDPDCKAQEYLIEVGTDEIDLPLPSRSVSDDDDGCRTASNHTVDNKKNKYTDDFPSPSSIRSKTQRAHDKKTIDPADYVVEVGI
jgi:hypothetical protein